MPAGDTDTVRRIVAELDWLDSDRVRYLAAFAYLPGRVAIAHREHLSVLRRPETGWLDSSAYDLLDKMRRRSGLPKRDRRHQARFHAALMAGILHA